VYPSQYLSLKAKTTHGDIMSIHPTALIDPKAQLDSSVSVGPFAVVGPHVSIGANTVIGPHCTVEGHTTIGVDNRFYAGVAVGGAPQDKKYAGEPTRLLIGDRNNIREYCTLNTGTVQDQSMTQIGNDNWIMAYVHIAHDVILGCNTILANAVQIAGHVHIGDWAIIGGMSGIHQFVKVGAHAMAGMNSSLSQDLPPFVLAGGNPCAAHGVNVEGLKRRGFSREEIQTIRRAFKTVYREGHTLEQAKALLAANRDEGAEGANYLDLWLEFLKSSTRGIVR
jgi:UDP-N-acetylglucosamine acyltransferase